MKTLLVKLITFSFFPFIISAQDFEMGDTLVAYDFFVKAEMFSDSAEYDSAVVYFEKAGFIFEKEEVWGRYLDCLIGMGNTYSKIGNYEKSLECYNLILLHSKEKIPEKVTCKADSYHGIGNIYLYQGDYPKAMEYFQKALEIRLEKLNDSHPHIAGGYSNIGVVHKNQGNYLKALEYHQKALELRVDRLGASHPDVADSKSNIGIVYFYQGNYQKSLEYFQKALEIRLEKLGASHPNVAISHNNIGVVYENQGNYWKALECHEKALRIRLEKLGVSHLHVADSYNNIGVIYGIQNNYLKALKYHEKALEIRLEKLGASSPDVALGYYSIGVVYRLKGNFPKALEYHEKALEIRLEKLGASHPDVAESYNSIGISYYRQSNYLKALEYYKKALEIRLEKLGASNSDVAMSYNNIGLVYENQGNYSEALSYLQKALEIWMEKLGALHPDVAISYSNIGVDYENRSNYPKALEYYQKALGIVIDQLGASHPLVALINNNVGLVYTTQKDYPKALEYFQYAIFILVHSFKDKSIYNNPKLDNIIDKQILLSSLIKKSAVLKSIYTIQSKNLYDLQTAFSTDSLSIALIDLINQENAEHETRKFLRTQVDTIYQNALETAHHLNKITKENDYNHHAFRIAEKSKAAILLSQLNDGEAKHFAGIPDSLLEKETSLKAGIGAYNKQLYDTQKDTAVVRLKINQTTDSTELARLEQQFQNGIDKINLSRDYVFDMKRELEQLIDTLENQYTEYHELKYKTNVVTVEELQQEVLTEEELLLEYMVGDTSVFVFAIAKDDFQIHEIPKPQQLEQWIDTLRMAMTDPELVRQQERQTKKWFVPAAHRLYQLLLEQPLNAVGPKVKRLVIVPGGRLHHLNFGVLLRERPAEGKRFRFKDLAYLCKDYAVSYQFSATLWHRSFQQQREANEQLLTFGGFGAAYQGTKGTDLTTRGFDGVINLPSQLDSLLFDAEAKMREVDLPFGRKEVQAADSLFRPESHIFLGAEATEQKFRETAHRYRVLHLSAHGLLDDQDPAYSKLLFTLNPDTSAADDDNLHVAEIYNLSLNADLTVLSACESGYYSDIQKGEGIMSLARAFAYAGCPALLMSQWSVNDRATASLMVSFYANLKKGLRKDVALQRAQMACLSDPSFLGKKWDHPYYWSGFVLSGDGRAMF